MEKEVCLTPNLVRVTKTHQPEPVQPQNIQSGDLLAYERRETPYADWIWCTETAGNRAFKVIGVEWSGSTSRRNPHTARGNVGRPRNGERVGMRRK